MMSIFCRLLSYLDHGVVLRYLDHDVFMYFPGLITLSCPHNFNCSPNCSPGRNKTTVNKDYLCVPALLGHNIATKLFFSPVSPAPTTFFTWPSCPFMCLSQINPWPVCGWSNQFLIGLRKVRGKMLRWNISILIHLKMAFKFVKYRLSLWSQHISNEKISHV